MAIEIDGFEVFEEIGHGGFGSVRRARQASLRREVAIKVLRADLTRSGARARFERECQAIGGLSTHPNVVAVYGNGVSDAGEPYLVMEYLTGGTLADRSPLAWQEAVGVGIGVAGALEAAHRSSILHRDVKPQNVIFTEYGIPKLADFGIASMADGFETQSGSTSVTLAYAAPEVLDGRPASERSDLYGLAATVVGAILGHAPFARDDDSTVALIARITTAPVPDLRASGVPDEVAAVLERAMAKHPEDRFATAAELRSALAAAAGVDLGALPTGSVPVVVVPSEDRTPGPGGEPGADPVVVVDQEAARPPAVAGRRRWAVAAAAVVLLGGVVAVSTVGGDDDPLLIESAGDRAARITTTTAADGVEVAGTVTTPTGQPSTDPQGVDPGAPSTSVGTDGSARSGAAVIVGGAGGASSTRSGTSGGAVLPGSGTTPSSSGGAVATTSVAAAPTTAATATTAAPPATTAPATTAAPGNLPPLLPSATFEFDVPVDQNTVIVPSGDKRLSAGWSDPDGTASWLCLQFAPQSQDFWLDGPDCEGQGLWVAAQTVGTRTIKLRAMECSPGCGAPLSVGERTIRINFYRP